MVMSVILWGYRSIYARAESAHMSTAQPTENEKREVLLKTLFTGNALTHRRVVWFQRLFFSLDRRLFSLKHIWLWFLISLILRQTKWIDSKNNKSSWKLVIFKIVLYGLEFWKSKSSAHCKLWEVFLFPLKILLIWYLVHTSKCG